MSQIPGLYIRHDKVRGRCVYTAGHIQKGDVIEVCPVIVIPAAQLPIIHRTVLHDYYFLWGKDHSQCALALGYGSLYNHEVDANAEIVLDFVHNTIDIVALSAIEAGSEITINYHGEQGDKRLLWWQK